MRLAASRPARKPAKQAISQTLRNTRAVVSAIGKRTFAPMLKTQTSMGRDVGSIRSNSATISSSLRASTPKAWASPPSARIGLGQGLELLGVAAGDDGLEALAGEAPGDGAAQGVAGADDDDGFAHNRY